jgi:hypothetical protein
VAPEPLEDDPHREVAGRSPGFSSSQRNGVDTGAPGFGRTE